MIYIILGMHKSGTTLVARSLHQSGIIMGQEFPENADYASVKYEAKQPQAITDDILKLSRKVLSLEVTSSALPSGDIDDASKEAMQNMIAENNQQYANWGFKDPRAALTYQYWKHELPEHCVIVVYRDPVEVWRRYSRVNRKWWSRKAFKVWADYNQNILDSIKNIKEDNVLFLKFEDLLSTQQEWSRFERFVDIDIVDVRDLKQSRFRVSEDKKQSFSYRFLSYAAGKETMVIYQQMETLRSGQLNV